MPVDQTYKKVIVSKIINMKVFFRKPITESIGNTWVLVGVRMFMISTEAADKKFNEITILL